MSTSTTLFRPTVWLSALIVLALWATLYLPGLGSLEIKGEEGRRILPAVRMLETGDFLVPKFGNKPYLRKPPLVNWLVAASFKLTGCRNEWTARMPSVLSVLAVAFAFITVARVSLGAGGSLMAALIWLTNFGMIEKGRLIEIEALYVSLFGLAIICWLSWWQERRSPWLTWTVPWIFLGLGLLAKGPLHLFFFYAVVLAVLFGARQLRSGAHLAHLAGIIIMLGIFAAWAVPYWEVMRGVNLAQHWSAQLTGRLGGVDFALGHWLQNIPRSLAYFVPWTLLLPLVCQAKFATQAEANLSRVLLWSCVIPFLAVNLLPGALPRYALPVLVPASWLLAMTLSAQELRWPSWLGHKTLSPERRSSLVLQIAVVAGLLACLYALFVVPRLQRRAKLKPIAAQIDALAPISEPLYAVDPDFQPYLFYVHRKLIYVSAVADVPPHARYLLVQPANEREAEISAQWSLGRAQAVLHIKDYRGRKVIIFRIGEEL
ncbi:MAG: glycosyltransferase family 39 protein [Verrucomicrobiota bacterium]